METAQNMTEVFYFEDDHANMQLRSEKEICFTVALLTGEQSVLAFSDSDFSMYKECLNLSKGTICIVFNSFFSAQFVRQLMHLPLFSTGSMISHVLEPDQLIHVDELFGKIRSEPASDYAFKFDLIRIYLVQLIHFSLKSGVDQLKDQQWITVI
jgi:hypothetical protein